MRYAGNPVRHAARPNVKATLPQKHQQAFVRGGIQQASGRVAAQRRVRTSEEDINEADKSTKCQLLPFFYPFTIMIMQMNLAACLCDT